MKKDLKTSPDKTTKPETVKELKNQTHEDEAVKKGYNEKNPTQPQGAFKPDAGDKKN